MRKDRAKQINKLTRLILAEATEVREAYLWAKARGIKEGIATVDTDTGVEMHVSKEILLLYREEV